MASFSADSSAVRRSLKSRQPTAADERRQQLLERQKEARRDYTQQARAILQAKQTEADHNDGMQQQEQREEKKAEAAPIDEHDEEQEEEAELSVTQPSNGQLAGEFRRRRAEKRRLEYASQFMTPQWLDSLPADLTDSWYAIPRPEGTRCFLIANHHSSMSRKRNGSVLHSSIATALPGGCHPSLLPAAASTSPDDYCIVDCIYNDEQRCYYALDLLCWRGYLLFDATAEFRLYWMHDKLRTLAAPNPSHKSKRTFYPLVPLPVLPCLPSSLPSLYPQSPLLDCRQDGVLFVHKASEYVSGVLPTPLCLLWKDVQCSRWYVATDGSGQQADRQLLTAWLDSSGRLLTEDGVQLAEVAVGQLMGVEQPATGVRQLVRVSVSGLGDDGRLTDVRVEGEAGRGRLVADSWDKVLYQANARRGGTVSIQQIAEAMQHGVEEQQSRGLQHSQQVDAGDEMKTMPSQDGHAIEQQSIDADMT